MKKVNVIDLDKTLIPFDSFERIVKREVLSFNTAVFIYAIARVLRLISLKDLKKKVSIVLEKKYENSYFIAFANELYASIDDRVMDEVSDETDSNTLNILLSASPDSYVKLLAEKLNWMGQGSYFDEHDYRHLHSEGKILWLENNYPINEFKYNLAISDSSTDDELLKLFKKRIKWILPSKSIKK